MGSEMCIRDSLILLIARSILFSTLGIGEIALLTFADVTINLGDCLLYTSDAADDLLCVDLGGRRIIKKKKTTYAHSNIPSLTSQTPRHSTPTLDLHPPHIPLT